MQVHLNYFFTIHISAVHNSDGNLESYAHYAGKERAEQSKFKSVEFFNHGDTVNTIDRIMCTCTEKNLPNLERQCLM